MSVPKDKPSGETTSAGPPPPTTSSNTEGESFGRNYELLMQALEVAVRKGANKWTYVLIEI
jgi:hypothetical protein